MVRNRLYASDLPGQAPEDLSSLCCAPEALPLPNNSLDAMVLHHALEAAADARSALREAARALRPGGRLVICTFNPLSLWGARRLYAHVWDDSFAGLRLVSPLRMRDWLALLGFELHDGVQYLSYTLPFSRGTGESAPGRTETLLKRLQPPVGGVYLISAVKQAVALRPHWRDTRVKAGKLLPAAYPKSAVSRTRAPVLDIRNWKDVERSG